MNSGLFVLADGVELADAEVVQAFNEEQELTRIQFPSGLPAESEIEVWSASGMSLLTDFSTGETQDTVAPEWDGEVAITNVSGENEHICASESWGHWFEFEGIRDDGTPTDEVLIRFEPIDVGLVFWGHHQGAVTMYSDGCRFADPSLETAYHRSYEVTMLDWAGNESSPVDIATGRFARCSGCNVSSSGGASGLLALWLFGIHLVRFRRE